MHKCSVCSSPKRAEVDRRLRAREPMRVVASATGFGKATIGRHSQRCLWRSERPIAAHDPSLQRVIAIVERAARRAERKSDARLMLEAAKQLDALRQRALLSAPPRKVHQQVTLRLLVDKPTPEAQRRMDCARVIEWLGQFINSTENKGDPRTELAAIAAARLAAFLTTRPLPEALARALDEAEGQAESDLEAGTGGHNDGVA